MPGVEIKPLALVSVTDKTGVLELAEKLEKLGYEILSTGGTAAHLEKNEIGVLRVEDHTGFKEILSGRVKTLHPRIHGGILFDRQDSEHNEQVREFGIRPIDVVVVNLYQFQEKAIREKLTVSMATEYIDIGGPSMLRASAKNFHHCLTIMDPADYDVAISALEEGGQVLQSLRQKLAAKVFRETALYDAMIADYIDPDQELLMMAADRVQTLRYGENPDQTAAFFTNDRLEPGFQDVAVLQGKELSYNNYLDCDGAVSVVMDLPQSAVAIIKHTNPCGVATKIVASEALADIYRRALACDPKSAFGGIVAVNVPVDLETAEAIVEVFTECVIAPAYSEDAREVFRKKGNLRLLQATWLRPRATREQGELAGSQVRSIRGGFLVQGRDEIIPEAAKAEIASDMQPTEAQLLDMDFAMVVAKHVKSNAIVLCRHGQTIAIGAGQMSRVDALRIAIMKAGEFGHDLEGSVLASDAFFPFRDCVDIAAEVGIKAIIQPGGSKRDSESMEACKEHKVAMVMTGKRHFKH